MLTTVLPRRKWLYQMVHNGPAVLTAVLRFEDKTIELNQRDQHVLALKDELGKTKLEYVPFRVAESLLIMRSLAASDARAEALTAQLAEYALLREQ